jgi:hypothetical protein
MLKRKRKNMNTAQAQMTDKGEGVFCNGMNNVEVATALVKLCDVARANPKVCRNLISKEEPTRDFIRKVLTLELSGDWDRIMTSPNGLADWWQIVLKNGAILRVSKG